MTAAEIAAALGRARREGRGWRCKCPLHGGCSLALRDGGRALLVKCWAGCETGDVLAELRRTGLIWKIQIRSRDSTSPQRRGLPAVGSEGARPAPVMGRNDDRADAARRMGLARRIWDAARDAREPRGALSRRSRP